MFMNPKTALTSTEFYQNTGLIGTCAYLALDAGQPQTLRIVALSIAAAVSVAFLVARTWLKANPPAQPPPETKPNA